MNGTVIHISEKPWSDYSEADYSLQQWHDSCLIHIHDGAPTSKQQCKLPVKTPNGALNRNGVHAAAAALAGARGGVIASPEQKKSAANALIRFYNQLEEKPPPSLLEHSSVTIVESDMFHITQTGRKFLEHFGIRGQKWGQRKSFSTSSSSSSDFRKAAELKRKPIRTLSNKDLNLVNNRLNLEQNFRRLNPNKVSKGKKAAEAMLASIGLGVTAYNVVNSPFGKSVINLGKKAMTKHT